MSWRLLFDDLRLIDNDQAKSLVFFFVLVFKFIANITL